MIKLGGNVMSSIKSMNRSSFVAGRTGVVLLALLACSFNVIAQGRAGNEPELPQPAAKQQETVSATSDSTSRPGESQPATDSGVCFCNYTPEGFLFVTSENCSTGYGPECDTSSSGTLCRCILRVCGDCDDGCYSSGLCDGKKPGASCSSSNPDARCNALENCSESYTKVCCGCS